MQLDGRKGQAVAKKVLIINGKKKLRTLLRTFLAKRGYSVLSAKNAKQALRVARSRCPDLILLDSNMPGQEDCEVLRKLKNDPRTMSIPVITLAGDNGGYATLGKASLYFESDIANWLQ